MKRWIVLTVSMITISSLVFASELDLTQTVRGTVIDQDSKTPIPGANVIIIDGDPILGTTTDIDGRFRLDDVPVGRFNLQITYLGYEDKVLSNLLVGSGKELVLNIELTESLLQLEEVVVSARENKSDVNNEMSLISSRTFSVEETKRYAGSFNDPARMVSSYAGVISTGDGNNDIIVRGNSPKGILWRLEGLEIPNPNHFTDEGSTGGPINALNSAMLANSDFYTGAFAPEYGNALSGVFDMKLRTGNNEKPEYAFSIGVLGTDFTMEGPFQKGKQGSYLVNYRYSSLALLDDMGVVDFGGVPKYQDMSFNMKMPTEKYGAFALFGLGGLSKIAENEEDSLGKILWNDNYKSKMGVVGLSNIYQLSENAYLKSVVSLSGNGSGYDYFEPDSATEVPQQLENSWLNKYTLRIQSMYNNKLDARNKLQLGAIYSHNYYNFFVNYYNKDLSSFVTDINETGDAGFLQAYVSLKHRFNEQLTLVSGLHYAHFLLNDSKSLEPRAGLKWQFRADQSLTFGAGIHSKLESLTNYFSVYTDVVGAQHSNSNLQLPKAAHFVIGYDRNLTKDLYFKTEVYYQRLYDVPVENDVNSSYATSNSYGWFTNRELVNEGLGENYGLEITLEKFFTNNYYFLLTGSLYESKYKAKDNVWRNSMFNGNYAGNFLFGKEFHLSKAERKRVIGANTKTLLIGGQRTTPIDLEASKLKGATVRDISKIYEQKLEDVFQINLSVYYRFDRKKTTHEIKLDVQNITNNQAVMSQYYNAETGKIETGNTQLGLLPVAMYRIEF